jgi:hypothetical protein
MSDIDVDKFLMGFAALLGLWFLWRIAAHLEAIRTILADIANATRATPAGLGSIQTSAHEAGETNRLLKLAIKKQWGSAIDLERFP